MGVGVNFGPEFGSEFGLPGIVRKVVRKKASPFRGAFSDLSDAQPFSTNRRGDALTGATGEVG